MFWPFSGSTWSLKEEKEKQTCKKAKKQVLLLETEQKTTQRKKENRRSYSDRFEVSGKCRFICTSPSVHGAFSFSSLVSSPNSQLWRSTGCKTRNARRNHITFNKKKDHQTATAICQSLNVSKLPNSYPTIVNAALLQLFTCLRGTRTKWMGCP